MTVFRRCRSCRMWSCFAGRVFRHGYKDRSASSLHCQAVSVLVPWNYRNHVSVHCRIRNYVTFSSISITLDEISCVHTSWTWTRLSSTVHQSEGSVPFPFRANKENKLDQTGCCVEVYHTPDVFSEPRISEQYTRRTEHLQVFDTQDQICSAAHPNLRSVNCPISCSWCNLQTTCKSVGSLYLRRET